MKLELKVIRGSVGECKRNSNSRQNNLKKYGSREKRGGGKGCKLDKM